MIKINYFELKAYFDNFLYHTYNIITSLINTFSYKKKKLLSVNIEYKNKYRGKKCFILGTGPSVSNLSDKEMRIINENYSFGVNSLYKSEVGRKISPNFYVLMDRDYINEGGQVFSDICDIYNNRDFTFITDYRLAKNEQLKFLAGTIYISPKKYPVSGVEIDITKDVSGVNNVVSYSILIAMYMGFEEIYLVGCDYNLFCTKGGSHCYQDDNEISKYNLAYYLKYFWLTTEFHYMIQAKSKKLGVKIINITKDSLLDAYQFGEFDKLSQGSEQ